MVKWSGYAAARASHMTSALLVVIVRDFNNLQSSVSLHISSEFSQLHVATATDKLTFAV